uniref:Uncharacterized protein n=1 Tax=Gossypium raimondii TaxID=29730 RepID=A0A0D2T6J5_GOSRA|nr:hypothetical protein B456_011G117800 [Gossypium raimondii]KJB71313.1 hypothetical protein B456_011G117800 [Gossypium raimondii]
MHLAHGDNFAAKRMRKLTQRRAVDYTSTVVRYMQFGPMPIDFVFITIQLLPTLSWLIQVLPTLSWLKTELRLPKPWITMQTQATGHKINVLFLL